MSKTTLDRAPKASKASAVRTPATQYQVTPRPLSPREIQVLEILVCGRTNKMAAAELTISEKTVEAHRANINRKLAIKGSAVEMCLKGIIHGYVKMPKEGADGVLYLEVKS